MFVEVPNSPFKFALDCDNLIVVPKDHISDKPMAIEIEYKNGSYKNLMSNAFKKVNGQWVAVADEEICLDDTLRNVYKISSLVDKNTRIIREILGGNMGAIIKFSDRYMIPDGSVNTVSRSTIKKTNIGMETLIIGTEVNYRKNPNGEIYFTSKGSEVINTTVKNVDGVYVPDEKTFKFMSWGEVLHKFRKMY